MSATDLTTQSGEVSQQADAIKSESGSDKLLPLGLRPDSSFAQDRTFLAKLDALQAETLSQVVQGAMNEKGWDREVAEIARLEFLRFFSLRHLTENKINPTPLADEFWHVFLTYTRDYAQFCERHFCTFIHHEPDSDGSSEHDLYYDCFGGALLGNDSDFSTLSVSERINRLRPRIFGELEGENWSERWDKHCCW